MDNGRWTATSIGILLLRIFFGITFALHGGQKLFAWFNGPGITGFADFLGQLNLDFGMPVVTAYAVGIIEFVGGILIFFGLFTRLSAFLIGATMAVAVLLVHWQYGFFLNPTGPDGMEYALIMFAIALCLVFSGAGKYALDVHFAAKPKTIPKVDTTYREPAPSPPKIEEKATESSSES